MNSIIPLFSVVIPTYRRVDALRLTLESLCAFADSLHEVILVDQSPAPECDLIRDLVYSYQCRALPVKLLLSTIPSSTLSRNIGFKASSGDWVIFCDDDVIWPVDLLGKFVKRLTEYPSLVMVGGLDFENPAPMRSKSYHFLRWLSGSGSLSQNRGVVLPAIFGKYPDRVEHPMDTEWAMGYWFAVKRAYVIDKKILFDEKLKKYAYAEDLDFTHRIYRCAKTEQMDCMLFPEIGVRHMVSREWRVASEWVICASVWNRYYIASKFNNGGFFSLSMFCILYNFMFSTRRFYQANSLRVFLFAHYCALRNYRAITNGDFEAIDFK